MSFAFPRKLRSNAVAPVVPVVDTSAYASGDAIGTCQTLNNVLQIASQSGTLKKVTIIDLAKQASILKILFFSKKITSTDQAAFDLDDVEALSFLGFVPVAATDYVQLNDNAVAMVVPNSGNGLDFKNNAGRSLFFQVVSGGTPTYSAAADLKFIFDFEGD